jgi:NAD(P)-dependent dehydrogenase (short-subunit alcohol dehydrogenase family)
MSNATVVLITGATAGIGRVTALHLAERGFHVIAAGRRQDALDSLRQEAKNLKLDTVRLDVTDAASIANARDEITKLTGGHGVDILVNNAGYGPTLPVLETTDEETRKVYETNVFGLLAMTREFTQEMLARKSGRIINVSSIGGRVTLPFFGIYNSTKYAVESISDALRVELAPFGIDVSLIEPGVIRTEFTDVAMSYVAKYKSAESPYAAVYARSEELRAMSDKTAAEPIVVARAIAHACEARRPRPRYVVPFIGKLFVWLSGWMPTRVMDWMLASSLGLTKKSLARLPAKGLTEAALG